MRLARVLPLLCLLALSFLFDSASAAPPERRPFIAYLCAAGGQQGTTFQMTMGGQNLRGARRVYVTGDGVRAKIIKRGRQPVFIRTEVRRELGIRLRKAVGARFAEQARKLGGQKNKPKRRNNRKKPDRRKKDKKTDRKPDAKKKDAKKNGAKKKGPKKPVELPDHPLLNRLDELSLYELRKVRDEFLDRDHRSQTTSQIAEVLTLEVTIDPNATPGDRELRLGTPMGLSNPMLFQVGRLPEFLEQEPNDFPTTKQPVLELPKVVNGQVGFRDLDRFRFKAKAGQKLVIRALARRLVPFLADAVPGWFQATLTLYEDRGEEVAYQDDYRFDPDPVMLFDVPADGVYTLDVRDSIDRGREDFVYRITIGEEPFVTEMFPLGGQAGVAATAEIDGWNLSDYEIPLNTRPGHKRLRTAEADCLSPPLYAVDNLPETIELEPNDMVGAGQPILFPRTVNGRIDRPGDVDTYRFRGKAGEQVVAELFGRRLRSPIDSLVRLVDPEGTVVAWNDDRKARWTGLNTHFADSYFLARLPKDGEYRVQVLDTQGHGGSEYAYRLRLAPPRPDFDLYATPSALNAGAGANVLVTVHAVRKDGFDGPIDISLVNAPEGAELYGARIPAGRDRIRMTLKAPRGPLRVPIVLKILGSARIGDRMVRRPAFPADDVMQAFLNRHLVPAKELLLDLRRGGGAQPAAPMNSIDHPLTVIPGKTAKAHVQTSSGLPLERLKFELRDAPPGITLKGAHRGPAGIYFLIAAEKEKAKPGYAANLIIDVYVKILPKPDPKKAAPKDKAKKKAGAPVRWWHAGILRAIPFVVKEG